MKIYTCWITCLLESYQNTIVAELVKKGYTVGNATADAVILNHENQVSALLAYSLYKVSDTEVALNQVYQDVSSILSEMKGYVYSIIISQSDVATWGGSNIFLKPRETTPQLPPNDDKKSKMN